MQQEKRANSRLDGAETGNPGSICYQFATKTNERRNVGHWAETVGGSAQLFPTNLRAMPAAAISRINIRPLFMSVRRPAQGGLAFLPCRLARADADRACHSSAARLSTLPSAERFPSDLGIDRYFRSLLSAPLLWLNHGTGLAAKFVRGRRERCGPNREL